MATEFEVPRGTAQGTSTQTILIDETRDLGYSIYTMQTALERLYLFTYGWGTPPIGYRNYAKAGIYIDSKNEKIYKMIGDHTSSLWAELGGAGGGTILDQFLQLTDTPNSYTGMEGYGVRVNVAGDGLEFYELPDECDICFTQAEKDKLALIEDEATKNETNVVNNCIVDLNDLGFQFMNPIDVSAGPVPLGTISANSPVIIVDAITSNGEFKELTNSYTYATLFNSGDNDVLTGINIALESLNSPNGDLVVSINEALAGMPGASIFNTSIALSSIGSGIVNINFGSAVSINPNDNYYLTITTENKTTGELRWLETDDGINTVMDINDQWLAINSNLTHQILGYKETTGGGGLVPYDGAGCMVGYAIGDNVYQKPGCGTLCGFTDLVPGSMYYVGTDGTPTMDITETQILMGLAISDMCISLMNSCGKVDIPETFHILTEAGAEIMTEGGDNIDHSINTDGDVV